MEKTITVRDQEITFKMHAGIPYLYKQKFKKDLFVSFQKVARGEESESSYEIIGQLAYIAAKEANKDITDNPLEWLAQFDVTEMTKLIIPEVSELWRGSAKPSVQPKKRKGKSTEK